EINGSGASITEAQQKRLLERLEKMVQGDYLIISGSRPSSIPFSFYENIVEIASMKQIGLIIDIPDVEMKQLLPYKPFLIKPNEHELAEMTGRVSANKQDAIQGAKELVYMGARNVIVSLGEVGAVLINDKQILQAQPPKGTLISSVGAGDSLVAGFIASFEKY